MSKHTKGTNQNITESNNMIPAMKKIYHDESGVAYGFFVIGLFIIAGTILYILIMQGVSQTNDLMNDIVGQGVVSQRTQETYAGQMVLIDFSPYIMVIGLFLWGIVRALEKKRSEG